jgi:hypothetical protein
MAHVEGSHIVTDISEEHPSSIFGVKKEAVYCPETLVPTYKYVDSKRVLRMMYNTKNYHSPENGNRCRFRNVLFSSF